MKPKLMIPLIAAVLLLFSPMAFAETAVKVDVGSGTARVVKLSGTAKVVKKADKKLYQLKKRSRLYEGDRVIVGKRSRIALRLPDRSTIRFDENTEFVLTAASVDKKKQSRTMRINMVFGKTWAKVSRFVGGRNKFAITSKTATAGVRGTTYRMNVNKDDSVSVKVYGGEVEVKGKPQDKAPGATGPYVLSKPTPIKGPHAVTMEKWVYIVGALQQIDILPDGTAKKPFRFDIEADLKNEWVIWNKQLDKEID